MIDFETAVFAKLPFVGISTDDPVNVLEVVKYLSHRKAVQPLTNVKSATFNDVNIWWTEDISMVTVEMYRRLTDGHATCVVINQAPSPLVVNTGVLPTPDAFYVKLLDDLGIAPDLKPKMVQVLRGLSYKTANEVLLITMARTGCATPNEVRKTRQMMTGQHPGLSPLDTSYDFYEWPKDLKEWLDLNDKYFLNLDTPEKLVPRGLLLHGEPGVGKSMAAMVLARHWDVPLFRLDVTGALNRYLGVAEGRISAALDIIEQNAPCVWLLDEAEKLFVQGSEEGTTQRILSQLLWWLQYHKARVITVITTNDMDKLPKELYRAERIDKTIKIDKLPLSAAKLFAAKVYQSVMNEEISMPRRKVLNKALEDLDYGQIAHAQVRVLVYDAIKNNGWLLKE